MSDFRDMLTASFGGIEIDVVRVSDDFSRAQAIHVYPGRDGASVEDMGREPRRTPCTIVWNGEDCLDRFRAFAEQVDGDPREFVHPLYGAYDARVIEFRAEGRGGDWNFITANVTFIEHSVDVAALAIVEDRTGIEQVKVAAAQLDADLSAAGLSSPIGQDAIDTVSGWLTGARRASNEIALELSGLANRIDEAASQLELATDLERYPVVVSLHLLLSNARRAADAVIATAPRLREHTVEVTAPLLRIAQDLYGAAKAVEKFERLLDLNTIPNPARVEAGTVITVEEAT